MKKTIFSLLVLALVLVAGVWFIYPNLVNAPQEADTSSSPTIPGKVLVASDQIESQEYHVSYGDKNLYGVLTSPSGFSGKKLPLLVIAHGFNDISDTYASYADHMAQKGYLVYRFDFYGGSTQSKSGGSLTDMSVATELEDLSQVLDRLGQEAFVDRTNVQLLGISQGGLVSMLYAADHPDSIRRLAFLFPAFSIPAAMRNAMKLLNVASVDDLPETISFGANRIGRRYVQDAIAIDAWSQVAKIQTPVLIVHGTADSVVPYDIGVQASQTFPNAQLVPVEGADHGTNPTFDAVAFPALDSFLDQ